MGDVSYIPAFIADEEDMGSDAMRRGHGVTEFVSTTSFPSHRFVAHVSALSTWPIGDHGISS
jgi:hypothetical protein